MQINALFCCAQFDFSIFDNTTKPRPARGKRSKKYPAVKPSYESTSIPRLYFGKLISLHITDFLKGRSSQTDYNPPPLLSLSLPDFLEGHAPLNPSLSLLSHLHPGCERPTEFSDPYHPLSSQYYFIHMYENIKESLYHKLTLSNDYVKAQNMR